MARPRRTALLALSLLVASIGAACLNGDDTTPAPEPSPAVAANEQEAPPGEPATTGESRGSETPRQGTGAGLATEADTADAAARDEQQGAPPDPSSPQSGQDAQEEPAGDPPDEVEAEPDYPPLEATIFVEPASVSPGEAFIVAIDATNASAASVALDGEFISLTREGDRFYAILPVPFEAEPGPMHFVVAVADLAGELSLQELVHVTVEETEFPVELVELDPTLNRLLDPDVVAEDRAVREAVQSVRSPQRFWRGYFHQPTDGVITSEFGLLRSYNGADPTDYHSGLDFAGALGTDVVAANAGRVAWTGETERRGRGVIIDHGGGIFSSYWHLANVATEVGTPVAAGSLIGRVGTTGLSTGPHLHWELTIYGVPVDPLPWLRELDVPDPLAPFDQSSAVNPVATAAAGP